MGKLLEIIKKGRKKKRFVEIIKSCTKLSSDETSKFHNHELREVFKRTGSAGGCDNAETSASQPSASTPTPSKINLIKSLIIF